MEIGLYIATHRDQLGISQARLAEAAGISRPYLTQIENGTRTASDDVLQRIIAALGIPVQQLMEDLLKDQMEPQEFAQVSHAVAVYDLLNKYMTPEQVAEVIAALGTPDQLEATVRHLAGGEPMPSGPDNWLALGKEDRRLVQRIVNRLAAKVD